MSAFADPIAALEEADFLAARRMQTVYLLDAGNQNIRVATHFTEKDMILEIVQPGAWVKQ